MGNDDRRYGKKPKKNPRLGEMKKKGEMFANT
jgi:hypothetical protein